MNKRLRSAIEGLRYHDHLCLLYETGEDHLATVVPFIRTGLEQGDRCIYIAEENTPEEVIAALKLDGIDTGEAIGSGALSVLTKEETYLKDGRFDPDRMIGFCQRAMDRARAEGYTGLRATGEMTWALRHGGLKEYESRLNCFFAQNDVIGICQYNLWKFTPETILDVIRTHPIVIHRGQICRNPYYVPPDEMTFPDQAYLEVSRLLYNILERERKEELRREMGARLKKMEEELVEAERAGRVGAWEWDALSDAATWSHGTYFIFGIDTRVPPPDRAGLAKLFTPESFERIEAATETALSGGEPFELELELACQGSRRWIMVKAVPRRDGAGRVTGLTGTVKDVTDRRLATEELYNHIPCGMHSLDKDGRFVRVNDTELNWLGYAREELVGKRFTDLLTPETLSTFNENFPLLSGADFVHDLYFELTRKDGSTLPVLLNATAIRDDRGNFIVRSIVYDMTERKKTEDELRRAYAELKSAHAKVKALSGLLPICASCKKIRSDTGYWEGLEKYIMEHSSAEFTHSICPECAERLYPEDYRKAV